MNYFLFGVGVLVAIGIGFLFVILSDRSPNDEWEERRKKGGE